MYTLALVLRKMKRHTSKRFFNHYMDAAFMSVRGLQYESPMCSSVSSLNLHKALFSILLWAMVMRYRSFEYPTLGLTCAIFL